MRKFYCDSDIGSVLVGNKEVRFALPNIGGDGTTTLEIYENGETCHDKRGYKFVTCIEGKFNVFSYDCSDGDDCDVIATLEGRYGVYQDEMLVALEQWR